MQFFKASNDQGDGLIHSHDVKQTVKKLKNGSIQMVMSIHRSTSSGSLLAIR